MKNKKIFFYLLIAIIIIIIVVLVVIFQKGNNNNASKVDKMLETQTVDINSIYNEKIFYPKYIKETNEMIFLADKGRFFYKYNLSNKQTQKLLDDEILGIQNVYYSNNANSAIVISTYPQKNIKLYNFSTKQISELNSNIQNITWALDSKQIIYLYNSQKYSSINVSDPDGKNYRQIKRFDFVINTGCYLQTDQENNLYYQLTSLIDNKGTDLVKINITSGRENVIAKNSAIFSFSPDNKEIIINTYNNDLINYLLIDSNGKELLKLDTNAYANLVAWANNNAYLYNIGNLEKLEKINLLDSKVLNYKINSSMSNLSNDPNDSWVIGTSADNKFLYFTNDDLLYSINLP